ncbi:MAG: M24 family metallopeptidase [Planctomycetota bacterium]
MAKTRKAAIPETYKRRLALLRKQARRHHLSALLITRRTDYRYLTGFTGEDSAVLVTAGKVMVISDGRFDEAINQECPWVLRTMRKGTLDQEIARVCQQMKLKQVAFEPSQVSVASLNIWRKKTRGVRLVEMPPLLVRMRRIKDEQELRSIRKAIRVAQDSFLAMRSTIRIGDTEQQLAARLEFEMKQRGSDGVAFPSIVAEGPNAALPHAHPGRRKVKKGSAILFDWGARIDGYCSDLTRLVFVGSIPGKIGEVYKIVLDAQLRAIATLRAGVGLDAVDAAARSFIKDRGFGDAFNHGLGHGFGLDVHEQPRISWQAKDPLLAGEVVTIEPGIYLPGVGGVRIEDDVIVTTKGRRVLSSLSKAMEDSVIPAR